MQRITLIFFLGLICHVASQAQTVTGSWYGRADVVAQGINSNYLTELIIKQKGNEVEGIFGYYFKDSYQSFFIRGTYNKNTRAININNLPILFHKSNTRSGIECPMNFEGLLIVSQARSLLRGTFYSDKKYRYTCPDLRVNFIMDDSETNQDSILNNMVAEKKYWQPQQEDFIVTNAANEKPVTLAADVTPDAIVDTYSIKPVTVENTLEKALIEKFNARKTIYNLAIDVESDSVRVSFYDNGDIDGDSISVFLNNQPVLVNQELTARALNIYLKLDKEKDVNELSMFAENLGKYPPNTALMIVTDGKNRYEVYLSSSLTQNAAIKIRRKR